MEKKINKAIELLESFQALCKLSRKDCRNCEFYNWVEETCEKRLKRCGKNWVTELLYLGLEMLNKPKKKVKK